jgi:hypothetical protein
MSEKYAYFYNGVWPIRATRGETGTFIGTETPDAATGKLKINMHWIDKVSHDASGDLTLIDKATFDTLCDIREWMAWDKNYFSTMKNK